MGQSTDIPRGTLSVDRDLVRVGVRSDLTWDKKDLIILWEASTAKPGTTYFDMQDLVVLVSFE